MPPGRYVGLVVRDTGTGMPPDVCSRIFEPFFTTKGVGKGTGLGLAVAHGIVAQSGGHIEVESAVGEGTTFTILFPLVEGAPGPARAKTPEHAVQGSETILLVEDEDAVRTLMSRALSRYGFTVLTAGDGTEAIRLARAHEGDIHLLATDVVMPGMNGRDLAQALRRERPGLRVLFMSGYTDDTLLRHGVYEAQEAFLQKPFPLQTLAAKVREVLSA
jgi:CheY-like chemotaxis protein